MHALPRMLTPYPVSVKIPVLALTVAQREFLVSKI
jgi:hypothetical protein